MGRKHEYATTTSAIDATKAARLVPVPPRGDDWEMCGSNIVPSTPRCEYYEDEGREVCKTYAVLSVIWFWKREVTK